MHEVAFHRGGGDRAESADPDGEIDPEDLRAGPSARVEELGGEVEAGCRRGARSAPRVSRGAA